MSDIAVAVRERWGRLQHWGVACEEGGRRALGHPSRLGGISLHASDLPGASGRSDQNVMHVRDWPANTRSFDYLVPGLPAQPSYQRHV
jgi:hypothetical protein